MKNNWYVITGAPSSGKTMLIEALSDAGVGVHLEIARLYIDEERAKGKTIEEIRENEEEFQQIVYQRKLDREIRLTPSEAIFFDRGMHDTLAYFMLYGFNVSDDMKKEINRATYKKVFLLEPVGKFERDYARTESEEEALKLHGLLKEAYSVADTKLVEIPAFDSKEERIEHFFTYLRENEKIFLDIE